MPDRRQLTRPGPLACALLALSFAVVTTLHAQPVRGIGDDALSPARGGIRVTVGTSISDFSERYGRNTPGRSDGSREPLGIDFTRDTLGVAQFPGLSAAQSALRTLTGNNAFTLNLGRSALTSSVRVQTTPIQIEAGVSRRLAIGVMIPLVSARQIGTLNVNGSAGSGTVGLNPARLATIGDSAIVTNTALVSQLTVARNQLAALLQQCNGNPGSNAQCPAIIANAPSINASATAFTTGIAQVYGTTVTRSSAAPFVPFAGTGADSAIRTRVATFRAQFQQFGITALAPGTIGPSRAVAALTPDGFQRAAADSSLGLFAEPLGTITRQGLGDMEVSVKLRLFDSFGFRDDSTRFLPKGMNLRQSFAGVYRFGTGTIDQTDHYLDLSTGDGQNDVEIRSFTDVIYGRRFFGSLIARYAIQLPDEQLRRITDSPDQVFAPRYRERLVQRDLGDQLEIEVTPRWIVSDFFSIGAQYLFRRKGKDVHEGRYDVPVSESGLAAPITLDASTLNVETEAVEQRVGVGVTFSTVAAHARGRAGFPIEVQYLNSRTITGSGGAVPKLSIHQVQVRLYPRL